MLRGYLQCSECGHTTRQENFRWFPNDDIALCKDEGACAERARKHDCR